MCNLLMHTDKTDQSMETRVVSTCVLADCRTLVCGASEINVLHRRS